MNKKKFFYNAFVLVAVTFLLRFIWTSFRVIVSNKVGAECMGLFQLTFAVYNISVTFASSGINFASTRLITQAIANNTPGKKDIMKKCVLYSLIFGISAFAAVFLSSDILAQKILCDKRTSLSLKAFSVSLPFISLSSAISGYFYAKRDVNITLVSRAVEQFAQIISFFAIMEFVPKNDIELSCFALTTSGAISEILGGIFLYLVYKLNLKDERLYSNENVFKKICLISIPSALGAYLKNGLQTIENILIPIGFRKHGATNSQSLSGYGMLCSMVMPVIFFPSFVLSSFSMLLIPEFTEAQTLNKENEIHKTASLSIRLTLYFSLLVSAIFICFGSELGELIYNSKMAGKLIEIMAPLIPFMYLDSIADGMLKGLGEYNRVLAYSSIDTVLSIIMIIFIIPKAGLYGYVTVIYVSAMLNSVLSISRILKISKNTIGFFKEIVIPFGTSLLCSSFSKMLFLNLGLKNKIVSVAAGIVFSVIISLFFGFFSKSEFSLLIKETMGKLLLKNSRGILNKKTA